MTVQSTLAEPAPAPGRPTGGGRPTPARGRTPSGKTPVGAARGRAATPAFDSLRVSLLPTELKVAKKNRRLKRWLVVVVLLIAAVVGAGVFAASQIAASSADRASTAQNEASLLQAKLLKYGAVNQLEQRTALAKAAARVGSSTQIDWRELLGQVRDVMPDGFSITGVTIDSATPLLDYAQGTTPLDSLRVGTVTVTASTPSIDALPQWLADLPKVRGYADAVPSVSSDDTGYTVVVTMHITDAAYITPLGNGATR